MAKNKKGFNLRSFTSFSLVFSTIVMSWSGFILYVAPPGRIANWADWKLMLFTKAEWQALHTIFSYLFFVLFVIHLFFINWKAFLTYIKSKVKAGLNRKWELAASTVVFVLFFIGTLKAWPPFGDIMAFGDKVKESWEKSYEAPPVAHMEENTLSDIAANFNGISVDEIVKTLSDSSIIVSDSQLKLKTIAAENKVTPSRIYNILTSRYKNEQVTDITAAPSGVGKMTVVQVAQRLGKKPEDLIKILKENGIDANEETTMRTIADQMSISPHDLYSLLAGK